MLRTRKDKKPLAILTSDWHLREDTPVCRTDDFWAAQWGKVDYISDLQKKCDCPVYHAGDLFHHWKPSPYLLKVTLEHLPAQFHTIYGQHDLPQHNLDLAFKCGINTLEAADALGILFGCHWGMSPDKIGIWLEIYKYKVLVWHHMVVSMGDPLKKFVEEAETAPKTLRKYDYDLIVTGDNHKSFVEEYQGRFLVNPGSLTRQTADQINHKPSVYLWFGDAVERMYLPVNDNVISRDHIDKAEQRDNRIDAFISKLNDDWKAELSFEENLRRFFETNQTREPVKEIIYKAIE